MYTRHLLFVIVVVVVSDALLPLPVRSPYRPRTRLWSTPQTDYMETVREGLAEAGASDDWIKAVETLARSANIEADTAEQLLARIWNWKAWATVTGKIARKYIKVTTPDPSTIETSIRWLQDGPLKLPDDVLKSAVTDYPDVYLIDPKQTYELTLSVAPKEFKNPDTFRESLIQDPGLLKLTYNCADQGCRSECGNCWVTYKR